MDLTTVREVIDAQQRPRWQRGDAWLAGGTYLFSEPQPHLSRLLDLDRMGWQPLSATGGGLEISATCTIAQLRDFVAPPGSEWHAVADVFGPCCRAFSSSFKVWNVATVGGNICLALPAGPMIALTVALDGVCVLWGQDGGVRRMPVMEFVVGAGRTALREGELLRSIELPGEALRRRSAVRRASLRPLGRSAALVVASSDPADGTWRMTITAATRRPVVMAFAAQPGASDVRERIEQVVGPDGWLDDVHGSPSWRRHMTLMLAEQLRTQLTEREERWTIR